MSDDLLLGIDGGGTSTVAWIACRDDVAAVLGRGTAGPSNPQAVGIETAIANLDEAIDAALRNGSLPTQPFTAACLAMAGIDREVDRRRIREWSDARRLTGRLRVVNDALPLLYAANEQGVGVAVISGTGSFAFGRTGNNRTARAGGWGYLFGDEGSAYSIAVHALRAAATAADGRGPATSLLALLTADLDCDDPQELITAVYHPEMTRANIAKLSRIVFAAHAAGDRVAVEIVEAAARELAEMVAAVAVQLSLTDVEIPLAITGGVLLNQTELRESFERELSTRNVRAAPVIAVPQPVAGALIIARQVSS